MADRATHGVVIFGGVDWWYHNHGHSDVQIAKQLASRLGDGRVIWVNSIGMRAPKPGQTDLVLTRYARKVRSTLRAVRRDPSGVTVLSPLFVPAYTEEAVRRNGQLLHRQLRALMRRRGITTASALITVPTAIDAALGRGYDRVVFNRSDVFSAFPDVDSEVIGALEQRLLRDADEVLYVNQGLLELEDSTTKASRFLGHGVDFDHFASARPGARPPGTPPEELRELARPIVGFYGALDDYTVDLDLLATTARRLPTLSVVVLGPKQMDLGPIEGIPNLRYLGPVPYGELPSYAAEFDVGLMPWLQNEWIERCNPIKLKEYLALGFPVVSTPFPELAPYRSLVHEVDPSDFVERVAEVVADEVTAEGARERRDAVRSSSWASVATVVADALELDLS